MANPQTDYQLAYTQAEVEELTKYIISVNPGISRSDAYTKAVRTLGRISGQERKPLR